MERQMHPNSLANLRVPKQKRNYGHRYQLPTEKIDELFEHLTEGRTLQEAAKEVEICADTAKKYYDKGDMKRGIQPLKLRLQIFQEKVSREFDSNLIQVRKKRLSLVTKAISKIEEQLDAGLLDKKISIHQISQLVKLEFFLRGGVIERKEVGSYSAEDIRQLAQGQE